MEAWRRLANNPYSGSIQAGIMAKDIETCGGYSAKVSGDIGELTISSVFRSLPSEYHVIDNVMLRTQKGSTQIDHIIVCPYGIFVIETKNHKGMIFGDCYGQVWTQVLRGAGRFKLYSPVLQNNGHLRHLSQQTKIPLNYMQGVIVFTNPDVNLSNVVCPFCFNVDTLYDYIAQFTNRILTPTMVDKAIKRIDAVNIDSHMNRQRHIDYVNSIKDKRGY